MVESKKKPYVIGHTIKTFLTCQEMLEVKYDEKLDDYLLGGSYLEIDMEEPQSVGCDSHWQEQKVNYREPNLVKLISGSSDTNVTPI